MKKYWDFEIVITGFVGNRLTIFKAFCRI